MGVQATYYSAACAWTLRVMIGNRFCMSVVVAAIISVALLTAFGFALSAAPAVGQNRAAPPDAMAAEEGPFRSIADEFVAAAAAGDRAKTARMISPAVAAKVGRDGLERFLAGEVLPFFSTFKEISRSVTVTRTADVTGFVFYMYILSKTDELRPFVIYVIEDGGAKVVANVLVNHLVDDRHCIRVASGWKCPDFR